MTTSGNLTRSGKPLRLVLDPAVLELADHLLSLVSTLVSGSPYATKARASAHRAELSAFGHVKDLVVQHLHCGVHGRLRRLFASTRPVERVFKPLELAEIIAQRDEDDLVEAGFLTVVDRLFDAVEVVDGQVAERCWRPSGEADVARRRRRVAALRFPPACTTGCSPDRASRTCLPFPRHRREHRLRP